MDNIKSSHWATIIFLILGIFLVCNGVSWGFVAIVWAAGSMIRTAQQEKKLKKPDGDKFFDILG